MIKKIYRSATFSKIKININPIQALVLHEKTSITYSTRTRFNLFRKALETKDRRDLNM